MNETNSLKKFLLVGAFPDNITDDYALKDLKELKSLVEAFGGKVVDLITQKREIHDKGMYIGKGKIDETAEVVVEKMIDIIVFNDIVKPGEIFEIKKIIAKKHPTIKIWDRVDLILNIFSKNAKTAEAKLQIELAFMRHMGPRVFGMGMIMSRQAGGIGTRGIGETNTELMKRHWRDQMKKVKERLIKLMDERNKQLDRRRKIGLKTISIIGYTNAGKTSLFNRLVRKKKLVENALFATLDSTVGKIYLENLQKEVIISDTIGFIKNLPPKLIDAFKSTLSESIHADILLHVIDASDEDMHKKIAIVEEIIRDLGISETKKIYIFNKIDAKEAINKEGIQILYDKFSPQFISVKKDEGIQELFEIINKKFKSI